MYSNFLPKLVALGLANSALAQHSFTVPIDYDDEITVSYYFKQNNELVNIAATDEGLHVSVDADVDDVCNILSSGMVVYAPNGQQNTLLSWNPYDVFHLIGPDGQPLQWSGTNAQSCPFGSPAPASSSTTSAYPSPTTSSTPSPTTLSPSTSTTSSAYPASSSAYPPSLSSSGSPTSANGGSPFLFPTIEFGEPDLTSPGWYIPIWSFPKVSGSEHHHSGSPTVSGTITSAPAANSDAATLNQGGIKTVASEYVVTSNGQAYVYTKFYVVTESVGPSTTAVSIISQIEPTLNVASLTAHVHKRHVTPPPTSTPVPVQVSKVKVQERNFGSHNAVLNPLSFLLAFMGLSICLF